MSSPAETVDQVFAWLRKVLGVVLPVLPFSGVYRRLTALFELLIAGSLPSPTDPLPWTIPIAGDWASPLPGLAVSLDQIRIQIEHRPVSSPPLGAPDLGAGAGDHP